MVVAFSRFSRLTRATHLPHIPRPASSSLNIERYPPLVLQIAQDVRKRLTTLVACEQIEDLILSFRSGLKCIEDALGNRIKFSATEDISRAVKCVAPKRQACLYVFQLDPIRTVE